MQRLEKRDLEQVTIVADNLRKILCYVDSKIVDLEKAVMRKLIGAECPICKCDDVEFKEKVHECGECSVWLMECSECGTQWLDLVWKSNRI